jgi:hypothetical protein
VRRDTPLLVVVMALTLSGCQAASTETGATPTVSTSSVATSPTIDPQDVGDVAIGLYTEYMDCMKNPPAQAAGQVSAWCASHNSHATDNLPANLEAGGIAAAGADPIVCAQEFPMQLAVASTTLETGNSAHTMIVETFASGDITIDVTLRSDSGEFLVDDILCPMPN